MHTTCKASAQPTAAVHLAWHLGFRVGDYANAVYVCLKISEVSVFYLFMKEAKEGNDKIIIIISLEQVIVLPLLSLMLLFVLKITRALDALDP